MLAVVASAALLGISLLHYLHGPNHTPGLDYLKYVALGAVALELPLVALKAFASLRRLVRPAPSSHAQLLSLPHVLPSSGACYAACSLFKI